ncbi:MAG: helix-turn-helix domain-containing protein [Patescibacteria group bacterium]
MDKILKTLASLGLSEKEAKVYLALYKIGQGTSYEVAKESGVKRPTVYLIMEDLRKKGLALVIPHTKNKIYIAKDPNEFINEYQSKINKNMGEFLSLLPTLTRPATDVLVFKGDGALVQGLAYGIHSSKDKQIYAFYAGVGKKEKVSEAYVEHCADLYKLGFKLKGITPSDSYDQSFRENDKKYGFENKRISPSVFSPGMSVEVCGSLVKLIFHKKKEVVIVDDKSFAGFYIQIFNLLWR